MTSYPAAVGYWSTCGTRSGGHHSYIRNVESAAMAGRLDFQVRNSGSRGLDCIEETDYGGLVHLASALRRRATFDDRGVVGAKLPFARRRAFCRPRLAGLRLNGIVGWDACFCSYYCHVGTADYGSAVSGGSGPKAPVSNAQLISSADKLATTAICRVSSRDCLHWRSWLPAFARESAARPSGDSFCPTPRRCTRGFLPQC